MTNYVAVSKSNIANRAIFLKLIFANYPNSK